MADDVDPDVQALAAKTFARPWDFVTSVAAMPQLPATDGMEIAFAGRSNVGKSSLINALVGQKALARTSNTPGRTQMLNYFRGDAPITLVDMPGYGFAKAPKAMVEAWTKLIRRYLAGRPNLARVYALIDARHGIKAIDEEMFALMDEAAVSYQVVLTKADKLKAAERATIESKTLERLRKRPAAFPEIILTSSSTREGVDAVRENIITLALQRGHISLSDNL